MSENVEDKVKDAPVEEPQAAPEEPPRENRKAYLEYMHSRVGDDFDDDDEAVYSDMLAYRKSNDESIDTMNKMFGKDPRMAQLISDVASGKRGAAAALARYYGKDVLGAKEGTDEWRELQKAEEERIAELERIRKDKEEYDANIEASLPVLDEFASKKKIDADEFLDKAYEQILEPIFKGTYTPELLEMLYNAMNYKTDVEDSFQSGVVAGRNQKIDKMRKENAGDGLPRLGASVADNAKRPAKKSPYRSSVWDD